MDTSIDTSEVAASTQEVVKRYPGTLALDHVSFSVRTGEVRALLGKNGAGKSTLIRLLSGVERPDEGLVEIGGRPLAGGGIHEATARGVATVYQELSLVPQMTVAENFVLGAWPRTNLHTIDSKRMKLDARATLDEIGADIDPDSSIESLPVAQQQMVEIARAIHSRPKLLILDEPTSALPGSEVTAVLKAVRRIATSGVAVIYVSHRMAEIREVADTATVMRDGQNVGSVEVAQTSTDEIVHMMLGQAGREVAHMVEREVKRGRGPVVLTVEHLQVPPKVRDVTFDLHAGEVLGLAGVLGSGRTELLRCLSGFDAPTSGRVFVNGRAVTRLSPAKMLRLGIGMTPEDRKRDGIVPLLGVDENMVMSRWVLVERRGVISARSVQRVAHQLASQLAIKTRSVQAPIITLSGGNQQKALLGRWLHAGVKILLLDEPTRGIDVEAKAQIYELARRLASEGVAIVFVSSELEELSAVCDRVLVLHDGAVGAEFSAPNLGLDQIMMATIGEHAD